MCDLNKIPRRDSTEDESEDNSDDNLKIVEFPSPKRKTPIKPSKTEKLIIESIEDENYERRLEEKAAKTKLNSKHVKNIIRHVVTNEHVLALVRKAENPKEYEDPIPYEPKLTRAKAKELLSSVPVQPWSTPSRISEVQALFNEDLQEDSSGDEYIPCEEESEDDRESSIVSDPRSVPPAIPSTPPSSNELSTHTNWTDDGIFKIPPSKSREDNEEEANIARRTRSKLCLSSTPLEVIEEAFIPPDITTDMYDMDCDNDDWMDFLKKFTRPLDEIAKATEDEEQDPEYNILADEEIDKVDKEELRVDKAVKVTRKELNNLIAELFEICTPNGLYETTEAETMQNTRNINTEQNIAKSKHIDSVDEGDISNNVQNSESMTVVNNSSIIDEESCKDIYMKRSQIPLLEQQMRQHVQLLTQNFILTYKHPELHHHSAQMKEYLLNLQYLCEGKERSMFYTVNLLPALKLIADWQQLCDSDSEEVKQMELHIKENIAKSIQRRKSANYYKVTFPTLILKTISNSEVFLYPFLLPKIPFKSPELFSKTIDTYTDSENSLIALGLEEFVPFLRQDKKNLTSTGNVQRIILCSYIQEYIMPHKIAHKLLSHIESYRQPRCASNPIKYYFQYKRAPSIVHPVYPLDQLQILPPKKRLPDVLPDQWKMYNYPIVKKQVPPVSFYGYNNILTLHIHNKSISGEKITVPTVPIISIPITIVLQKTETRKKKNIQTKVKNPQHRADPISKFVDCLCRPSQIQKLFTLYSCDVDAGIKIEEKNNTNLISNIFPNMPNLSTPTKNMRNISPSTNLNTSKIQDKDITSAVNIGTPRGDSRKGIFHEFSTISSTSFQQPDISTEIEFCNPTDSMQTIATTCTNSQDAPLITSQKTLFGTTNRDVQNEVQEAKEKHLEKDNPDDINALMIASSTVKSSVRKEPSGAEKKRAKLRREFLANLSVSTPEDPEVEKQKREMFALAYYDKMRETLELEDYHKIMQILNDHEEGDAVELYKKVKDVLRPKYEELADEFLLFLREKEATAAGEFTSYTRMRNRSKFLRKLEIYFKDQPAQLRKIYKCLTELSQNVGVSMEKIKNTLLPMFKGNGVLSDLFLQNFLDEQPPPSLLEGPYETIDISKEMSRPDDEEIYETITVPDVEDKYGGPSCICNCHQIEDHEFKSRYRHCIRCGTKFINGKVYIQTGRGLRPATVSFLTSPNTDHNIRLLGKTPTTANQRKKRLDSSPSKHVSLSPTKENLDEESEDDVDGKKKSKKKASKRKTKSEKSSKQSKISRKSTITKKNTTSKCDSTKFRSSSPVQKEFKSNSRKRTYSVRKPRGKNNKKTEAYEQFDNKPNEVPLQQKGLTEESMEWEDGTDSPNVVGESIAEIKLNSPDHQTAESESEFCEESSQDNCESDSNSSVSSSNNHSQSDSNVGEESSWKREEDKIILETFQKENDKEHAFKIISSQLKNRTVPQISNRFQTLMTLLLETLGST